jgi:MFS family permease
VDTSRSRTGALTTRAMWAVLAVVIIADVMDLLDATITNIAAPTIVRDLGGGEMLVKWLGSSYALALGVLLVMGGRLGDRYGQRRLFLIGIAGFTIASLACGLSVSPVMLITARLCQGAFGALLIPQGIAIMTAHFSREMMGKAFSLFGPALGLSMVGGPILAGFSSTQTSPAPAGAPCSSLTSCWAPSASSPHSGCFLGTRAIGASFWTASAPACWRRPCSDCCSG